MEEVKGLCDEYEIDIISVGNGTASRESEEFVSNTLKIVTQMGVKTCTADIGVCDIRMVLKGRLVIYR